MGPIIVVLLLAAVVMLQRPGACEAATPPDPLDPSSLDVVLSGAERLPPGDVERLREEAARLWAAAGVVLGWPTRPSPPRPCVEARIDWNDRHVAEDPRASGGGRSLGWIRFVDGRPAERTIVISAAAAMELLQEAAFDDRPVRHQPQALRDRLLARALARALAHEIGHYLLGPTHAPSGLMRAHFPGPQLIEPSASRFGLTRQQVVLVRQLAESAPGLLAFAPAGSAHTAPEGRVSRAAR